MGGNDVGDVDLPIRRLAPHAAAGRAGVSISLVFTVVGDVIDDQRLIRSAHCRWRSQENRYGSFRDQIFLLCRFVRTPSSSYQHLCLPSTAAQRQAGPGSGGYL